VDVIVCSLDGPQRTWRCTSASDCEIELVTDCGTGIDREPNFINARREAALQDLTGRVVSTLLFLGVARSFEAIGQGKSIDKT